MTNLVTLRVRVLAVMAFASLVSVSESAIIAYQDGDTSAHDNWSISAVQGAPAGALNTAQSVGGHGNAGEITDSTGVGPDVDIIYNTSGLVGNFLNFSGGGEVVRGFSAEFYAYQAVGSSASDFRLYMLANGNTWYYDIGPLDAGWNQFYANMAHADDPLFGGFPGWYSEIGRTVADLTTDLASVTQIGFELQYLASQANQVYGFDYIGLYDNYFVPEPETYLVLAVALASLAFIFREELRRAAAGLRQCIRA